jgi:hypothetical protein
MKVEGEVSDVESNVDVDVAVGDWGVENRKWLKWNFGAKKVQELEGC